MLAELLTHDFITFTQTLREPKDDYAKRKVQKDRLKVKELLDGLLRNREVIIFYLKDGVEHQIIGTTKKYVEAEIWPELHDAPVSIEVVNNLEVEEFHHCQLWSMPDRTPMTIHLDTITKFVVSNTGLDYAFFQGIRNGER